MHSKTNVISTYEFQFDLIEHGCSIGLEVCHIKGGAKINKRDSSQFDKNISFCCIDLKFEGFS